MINVVYHAKPLIFYRIYISEDARLHSSGNECKLLSTFEFIKAVSDTVFDMINAVYHDKLLVFIKPVSDTALDMINLVAHHRAVNQTSPLKEESQFFKPFLFLAGLRTNWHRMLVHLLCFGPDRFVK